MTKINWKFKDNLELNSDCDFYYDLTMGGYIKPEELLENKDQIDKLKEAIAVVVSFEEDYISLAEEQEENEDD